MSARDFNDGIRSGEMDDYVPAIFARTPEEAEEYCQVLEDHDIPAVVDEEFEPLRKGGKARQGVAVLVPQSRVEDARAFIAELEELEKLAEEDELDADDDEEEEKEDEAVVADEEDDLEADLEEEDEKGEGKPLEKRQEDDEDDAAP